MSNKSLEEIAQNPNPDEKLESELAKMERLYVVLLEKYNLLDDAGKQRIHRTASVFAAINSALYVIKLFIAKKDQGKLDFYCNQSKKAFVEVIRAYRKVGIELPSEAENFLKENNIEI